MAISRPAGGIRNSTVAASSSTMDAVGAKRVVSERIEVRGGGRYLVTTYSDGTDDVKQIGPATANPGTPPVSNTGMPDDGASAFDPVDVPRSAPKQVDSIVFDSGDNKIRRVFFDDGSSTQSIIGPSDAVVQRREQEEAERERQRLLEEKNRREREEREREARRKEEERLYFLEQDRKREEERQRLASTVVSDEIIENDGRRIRQIKYGDGRVEANDIGPIPVTIVSEDIIIDGINKIRQVRYSDGTIKADVIGLSDAEINRRNEERVAQQRQKQQEEERKRLEELDASASLAEVDEVLNEPPPTTAPAPPIASPTIPDDGALPVTAPSIPDDGATQDLPPVVATPEPEPPSPLDGSVRPAGGPPEPSFVTDDTPDEPFPTVPPAGGPPAPSFTTTSVTTSPDTGTGQTEFVPEDAGAAMAALQGTGQPAVEPEVELPGSQGADTFTPSTPPVVAAPKVSIPDDGATPPPPASSIPDDGELVVPKREPAASNTANVLPDDGADADVVADSNENKERSYNLYQDYYNNFNTQLAAYPELEIANVASQNEFFDFYDSIGGGNVSNALNLFFAEKDQQRLDAIAADNRRKGEEAIRQAALDAEKKAEPTPIIPDDGAIEVPPVTQANTIPDDGADNVVTPPEPRIPDDGADTVVKVPDPPTLQVNTIPDDGALADEVVTPPVTTEIPKDSGLAEVDQILNEFVPAPVMIDDGETEVASEPDPVVPRDPIIDDGANDDIIEEAPTVVVGGPGDVEEVEQTEVDTPFLPRLDPPVTGGPGDIVEEPPKDSMIDDGDDEATRKAEEERKAREAEEAAEAERQRKEKARIDEELRQEQERLKREEEAEKERQRQKDIDDANRYMDEAVAKRTQDQLDREAREAEAASAAQAAEDQKFVELTDALRGKPTTAVNFNELDPNLRKRLLDWFSSDDYLNSVEKPDEEVITDPAAELPTGSLLGDLDATVYGGDDPEPEDRADVGFTFEDYQAELDKIIEDSKIKQEEREERTRIVTSDFVDSLKGRVTEVLNDLDFDSESYEEDQLAALEADYEESKARLARQFGIDPGGAKTGRAARSFELLEADRIQKRAAVRQDVANRLEASLDRELAALNDAFQFAVDTEFEEKKLDQANEQFQKTLETELTRLGLSEIQVAAAVKQINSEIMNTTRATSASIGQDWAAVTGKTGTASGKVNVSDLGISLDYEDILSGFLPSTTAANKRFLVSSSFEALIGRLPTSKELARLMNGEDVEIDSMPTLESRKIAAEVTQQNMERFAKYAAIADETGLARDKFEQAQDEYNDAWALTTGNVAEEFGLDPVSFSQAQYMLDGMNNMLFFDDTLTPEERAQKIQENEQLVTAKFFVSDADKVAFRQASSLFARTIGDQQNALARAYNTDAETFRRAQQQVQDSEDRFLGVWGSLVEGTSEQLELVRPDDTGFSELDKVNDPVVRQRYVDFVLSPIVQQLSADGIIDSADITRDDVDPMVAKLFSGDYPDLVEDLRKHYETYFPTYLFPDTELRATIKNNLEGYALASMEGALPRLYSGARGIPRDWFSKIENAETQQAILSLIGGAYGGTPEREQSSLLGSIGNALGIGVGALIGGKIGGPKGAAVGARVGGQAASAVTGQ